jgi:archaellum biogenesis ATPase FlaH
MDHDIQIFIVKGLFESISYFRNTALNLDPMYFDEDKAPVVKFIKNYFTKYEKIPEYSVVMNTLMGSKSLSDDLKEDIEDALNTVKKLDFNTEAEGKWLFDKTKDFANNKSFFNALKEGAEEMTKEEDTRDYGSVQRKMEKALSMTWDEDFGIEFFDETNIDEVYDKLGDVSLRIPLGESNIDAAINGGIPGETKFCGVFVGEAGLGKTLILGHSAMNAVKNGKNALYITFEIDEKEFRKRMDASFTDYSINDILNMRDQVKKRVKDAKTKGDCGRFIIKEYPPASVSALEIESFLYSLKLKKDFVPDIIYLDYLGIMVPISKDAKNSYERGKMVCEEIRALSDRFKCPILTAAQANRSGYGQNNVDMDNIADSMGIAHTADLIISLAQPEELKENSQIKFEVIKSRISRKGSKGIVDVDYDRMKFIDEGEKGDNEASDAIEEGLNSIKKKKDDDNDNKPKNNNDIT